MRVEVVLPTFLPCEVGVAELRQRHATNRVIKRPARGNVSDEKHASAVPANGKVMQEPFDPLDGLAPALAAWVRQVDVAAALGVVLVDWLLRLSSVVTLAKPPVEQYWDVRAGEGDLHRFDSTTQVRAEHHVETVVLTPGTQGSSLFTANSRQVTVRPTASNAPLVVLTGGVRLEDDLDHMA